ncbi:MAG: hypothetical protein Q7U16_02455 [Agitococcus sp.]|nr:hypothetical protein [Agitococcus sp.]
MTKPMNPLLRAENRGDLIRRGMASIDALQTKVIDEANKQIENLAEFENTYRQKLAHYKKSSTSSSLAD